MKNINFKFGFRRIVIFLICIIFVLSCIFISLVNHSQVTLWDYVYPYLLAVFWCYVLYLIYLVFEVFIIWIIKGFRGEKVSDFDTEGLIAPVVFSLLVAVTYVFGLIIKKIFTACSLYIQEFSIQDFYVLCCFVIAIAMFIPVYKFLDKKTLEIEKQLKEKQAQKRKKYKLITHIKAYKRLLNWRKIRKNKSFEDSFLNKGIYKR